MAHGDPVLRTSVRAPFCDMSAARPYLHPAERVGRRGRPPFSACRIHLLSIDGEQRSGPASWC